ncbi:TonB-linked SusC/RagA family outer membrane protein [Mariniflexile fucanivorans]|uniref:TonB-linked SusC/RagA family outer membrane protein n=1 Tax=Mariniflexile fucanivorans TaxID=264023 RepID=A0A4R1RL21_9FLAO|nr:TonB-dependent receptor [Mariniflexile fucanivorans]TCL66908.1 TonB-linked SusC/RagA family outer membrane protein [Mariniflexile fucanivorans]
MMKKQLFFKLTCLFFILLSFSGYAQNKNITGNVKGEDGMPLPGVSILVKGTTTGTMTDFDGNFALKASPQSVLVISYVGMETQEVLVGAKTNLNLVMKSSQIGLDEVIVVGYGTQKKSDVTGSVVSVSPETLEARPRVSVEQMLQGTMAGMNITVNASNAEGSSNTMLIRGQNSITAKNSPLIILDGIPYAGNLSEINPKDIGSIEVLKDASAAAIYGSRGSNGVILITSKKGKDGSMTVNYSATSAFNAPINIPSLMSGKTFYDTKIERGLSTSQVEDEGYDSGRNTNWVDLATRTGVTLQHDLSFSGGSEKTRYYVSLGYLNSEGTAIGNDFKRYTLRINLDHKLLPWMTFNTSTQYGYYDRSGVGSSFSDAFSMTPLGVPFNEDGSQTLETWDDGVYVTNPLAPLLYDNCDKTRRFTSNNSMLIDVPFIKGLSYKLNTGYDYRSRLAQTYRGRNTRTGLGVGGSSDSDNRYNEDWLVENIISYKNTFGKHSIFLTGLYSAQSEWAENHDVHAEGFPNDVMSFYQANKASLIEPDDTFIKSTHLSQMLRANYAFDSRYLLTLTARRDGYSAFGTDSKFGVFPSAAVGWNISNEKFLENSNTINNLKLRLSYGEVGNESVDPYSTLPTLASADYVDANDGTLFGFYPSKLGDPTLGWETTTSFNAGLDFGLFKNRIKGLIDVYKSKTTDLLLNKTITPINGVPNITQNIGETSNSGIEFQISSVNINKNDFKWSTDFNIAHYNTKIVNVGLTDADGNYIDDVGSKWFIGQPISVNFDYVFDGIYQQDETGTPQGDVDAGDIRYLDADESGTIDPGDKQIIGRKIPDFVAGLTNTFEYKNWSLSFFLNMVSGITQSNALLATQDIDMRQNRYNVTFWTPDNQSNSYPRNDRTASVNPRAMQFYRSTDFIRLQDVTLNYRFPSEALKKLKINSLELFTNIKNLYTSTDWIGLDPEFSNTDGQQTAAPQTTTILLGLKIRI